MSVRCDDELQKAYDKLENVKTAWFGGVREIALGYPTAHGGTEQGYAHGFLQVMYESHYISDKDWEDYLKVRNTLCLNGRELRER